MTLSPGLTSLTNIVTVDSQRGGTRKDCSEDTGTLGTKGAVQTPVSRSGGVLALCPVCRDWLRTTASLGFLMVDPASPPALTLREYQRASPVGQDGTGERSYTVCGQ